MTPVPEIASSVLAAAIRRQPLSPAKVSFAWQMASGPQLARATNIEIDPTSSAPLTLLIRARDRRWAAEIDRLRPMLTERLAMLLGSKVTLRIA